MASKNVLNLKFFTLLLLALSVSAKKLNVARILLPLFDDIACNFTLQLNVEGNCLKWNTTKDNVISLTPIDYNHVLDCSPKVVVSPLSKDKGHVFTDVVAEDVNTRQTFRCVVIVDSIYSLAITTTTRELTLEGAPEIFEVRAYDNQGNEFTTLAGVPFEWMIANQKNIPVLNIIPFKDSSYETPASLMDLEDRNLRGNKILIEGVKTGISKVTVKLCSKEYKNVKSNEIQISVVANLMLSPKEVYVMEGDTTLFKIIHTSFGHSEVRDLENSQYYLEVENTDIATTKKYSSTITGQNEGTTYVTLRDKNIAQGEIGVKQPMSTVHVVKPAYMLLTLLPHNNWAALVSEVHQIVADVYSVDDRKIAIGTEVVVQMTIGEAFHVKEKSKNGTWLSGWTKTEGVAPVQAVLESVGGKKPKDVINAVNEIVIYPRIVLIPSEVILPWDPIAKPKYNFEVEATGGDGRFLWSSTNHTVGAVTQYGKVLTYSFGHFEVSAAMHKNHHNRQTAKVYILPPAKLEIVEFVMEAEVGSVIYVHVALYAEKKKSKDSQVEVPSHIPFTKCQDLPFKVKLSDPKFAYNKKLTTAPVGIACGNIAVTSNDVGTSKVTVSYVAENGALLTDSVTVRYFKPLKMLKPITPIVLAVGTRANLIFTGGPSSISGKAHNKYVVSSKPEVVKARDVSDDHRMPADQEYSVVSVLCQQLGKSEIQLSISNAPMTPNCKNQETTGVAEVICGKPRRIEMYPEIKVTDAKSCPMDLGAEKIVVQSDKDVDLIFVVRDDQGRAFLNISSLKIKWETSPENQATLATATILERTDKIGTAQYFNSSYQKITPKVVSGSIKASAAIVGYLKGVLGINKITAEWPEFLDEEEKGSVLPPINSTIHLYLVDDTVVTPSIISIYNHPSNRQMLDVKQGSGYYSIALSKPDVVDVVYVDKSRQLDIIPKTDGEVTVKLIDMCLVSKPAVIVITVVSVHIIRVEMSDKVEINKCITCVVRLYDELDNLLTIPNLDLIDLDYSMERDIAFIERDRAESSSSELRYIISGVQLGESKLVFSVGNNGNDGFITSAPIDLQVFPPLKLFPKNATLTAGSQLQYNVKGGPQPTPNLEYTIGSTSIGKISSHGILIAGGGGDTDVKVRAVGTNPTTGQKIIYSEDRADLKVIKLNSIKLGAPLTRFLVDSTVPLWAVGVPDQISPIMLASIEPPIEFNWSVQDSSIAKITGLLDPLGINNVPNNCLSVKLVGLNAGTTTIYLNATVVKNGVKGATFHSSIDIEVIERLLLVSPSASGRSVLLAPQSQMKLETNMDRDCEMSYMISDISGHPPGSVVSKNQIGSSALLQVSQSGIVKSSCALGTSLILVSSIDSSGLKQSLTIPIEVKPIHYMMLSVKSSWTINQKVGTDSIPAGTEFTMHATYYDNVGNKFAAGLVELQVTSSRFDLVHIRRGADNSSFYVSAKKPGVTGVKVWADTIEKTAYYVKLVVEQAIKPSVEHVTVGDIICFTTPVVKQGFPDQWISSDENLISIDQNSGIATVVGVRGGQAVISHNLHPIAPLQIKINPVTEITLELVRGSVSNAPGTEWKIHFVAKSANTDHNNNLRAGWNCSRKLIGQCIDSPFICDITFEKPEDKPSFSEVFSITTEFDPNAGKYYCSLIPSDGSSKKHNDFLSNILVSVTEQTFSKVKSNEVKVKFLPALYVPNVLVVNDTFIGYLQIQGHPSILKKVEASEIDRSIVCIHSRKIENNTLILEVELMDYHKNLEEMRDFMSIIVESKETNQYEKVLITATNPEKLMKECPAGTSAFLNLLQSNKLILSAIIATFLAALITFLFYAKVVSSPPARTRRLSRALPNSSIIGRCPTGTCSVFSPCGNPNCLNTQANISNRSMTPPCNRCYTSTPDQSQLMNTSGNSTCCYCTRNPELRRNRRYL